MCGTSAALAAALAIASCARGEHRAAREKYNDGIALLAKADFENAEKALIDARAEAGVDPELRFRAAFDLGVAYAAHADKTKAGQDADLSKALELEQEAISWFFDAQRLRKDDADTKTNLAIARARAQAISDQLRKGENKLEARLDTAIKDERAVLDDARGAWLAIKEAHGADPLAQQSTLVHLADKQRGILAETGVIGDLAGDEIDAIGKKPEDKRSEEEKVRVVQLKNLDLYLMDARTRIGEARKKLQELAAEDGVARAETALASLKRAREQLLDPIAVLRAVAGEQLELARDAHAPSPTTPDSREAGLRDRVEEVRARLEAGVAGKDQAKDDQKKLLERVAAALPHVAAAKEAMEQARDAFATKGVDAAEPAERQAVIDLAKAIEQFADLKQTIDLADEAQHQIVTLLDQKAKEAVDELTQNAGRLARIKELLAEEAQRPPKDPKDANAAEQLKQQLAAAELLRADAEKAIAETQAAIKANKEPQAPAKRAADKLDELRKLFFNLIEHLQELIRQQGETRDQTSKANGEDDFARAPKLPGITSREHEHGEIAKAIHDALAQQADAAAKQSQPPQQGAIGPKQLAGAAQEVQLAQNDIADAGATLGKAVSAQQSVDLKPVVDSEGKALEHLENALKLLQPPKQQNKDQDKDKQQQQQQQQQQEPQPQGGAGQRARDQDAKRQRERRQQQQGGDPVDQDW
jgi:hypothetical protein